MPGLPGLKGMSGDQGRDGQATVVGQFDLPQHRCRLDIECVLFQDEKESQVTLVQPAWTDSLA